MHPAITEQLTFEHTRDLRARAGHLALARATSDKSRRGTARLSWWRARLSGGHRRSTGVVIPLVRREA